MCENYLVRLKKSLIVDTFGYFNQYESQHKEEDFTPVSFEYLKVFTRIYCGYNF